MWHASCISLFSTGCFLALPLIEDPLNEAPQIIESNPPAGQAVVLDTPSTRVWIIVSDDAGPQDLEYRWTIDGLWEQGTAEPIITENTYGSILTLDPDPLFDGRHLRIRVYDAEEGSAEMDWEISVPEEAR